MIKCQKLYSLSVSSSISLTSSYNPSYFSQPTSLVAVIHGATIGSVSFFDGATNIGSAPIGPGGIATLNYTGLSVGTHLVSAQYQTLTSAPVSQTVNAWPVIAWCRDAATFFNTEFGTAYTGELDFNAPFGLYTYTSPPDNDIQLFYASGSSNNPNVTGLRIPQSAWGSPTLNPFGTYLKIFGPGPATVNVTPT